MSKASSRQKLVMELIKKQCDFWMESNDLHSPSHATDILSELGLLEMDGLITEQEENVLYEAIAELWVKVADMEKSRREKNAGIPAADFADGADDHSLPLVGNALDATGVSEDGADGPATVGQGPGGGGEGPLGEASDAVSGSLSKVKAELETVLSGTWQEVSHYERCLMLALADVVEGRAPGVMAEEARMCRRSMMDDEAQAIEDALVLGRFGISFSQKKLEQMVEQMTTPIAKNRMMFMPKVDANNVRMYVSLVVDAPWFKNAVHMPVAIGMPEMLRAFMPKPSEHDMEVAQGLDFAGDRMREQIRQQMAEREKWSQVLSLELQKGMQRWLNAQDPVKGVLPENVLP